MYYHSKGPPQNVVARVACVQTKKDPHLCGARANLVVLVTNPAKEAVTMTAKPKKAVTCPNYRI
jgi:hypothetical protein